MSCCVGGGGDGGGNKAELQEQYTTSKLIDRQLFEDAKELKKHIKLLLLGAGESGKSTVAKQLKIIHMRGFTAEEKSAAKSVVYRNVVDGVKALASAALSLNPTFNNHAAVEAARSVVAEEYFAGPLSAEFVSSATLLWAEPAIKDMCAHPNADFHIGDSTGYFLENLPRIAGGEYLPSSQDIVRARSRTTGVKETQFPLDGYVFRIVDVGGQRSERRKWAGCFEDVTAVIFCVSLSEYDMTLAEDSTQNRMHESLLLFKQICNNHFFANTAIIIFLNKRDLFQEKITRIDLKVCFPDYAGGLSYDNATNFINKQFLTMNENPKKLLYTHLTCATDTDNIVVVFKAVKDIVLRHGLEKMGIME